MHNNVAVHQQARGDVKKTVFEFSYTELNVNRESGLHFLISI